MHCDYCHKPVKKGIEVYEGHKVFCDKICRASYRSQNASPILTKEIEDSRSQRERFRPVQESESQFWLPIQLKGFEGRDFHLRPKFWTSGHIYLDNQRIKPKLKNLFKLEYELFAKDNNDQKRSIIIRYYPYDPIPFFIWEGETVRLVPSFKWYEYIPIFIPVVFGSYFGAMGGILGFMASATNTRWLRSKFPYGMRYLLGFITIFAALGAMLFFALYFTKLFQPILQKSNMKTAYEKAYLKVTPKDDDTLQILTSRAWRVESFVDFDGNPNPQFIQQFEGELRFFNADSLSFSITSIGLLDFGKWSYNASTNTIINERPNLKEIENLKISRIDKKVLIIQLPQGFIRFGAENEIFDDDP
ncbi:MAG: hypothetical protein SFU91_11335 [Chloroherpetonaceae bacterium]|nr:hypothetical protein [Chloroherpetonaceae bacterium]